MEPIEVKQNIKNTKKAYENLKQEVIANIKNFVDYLRSITPNETNSIYLCADKNPYLLPLTKVEVEKIYLNTDDGVKMLFNNQELVLIQVLPLEDLIALWTRLYYQ